MKYCLLVTLSDGLNLEGPQSPFPSAGQKAKGGQEPQPQQPLTNGGSQSLTFTLRTLPGVLGTSPLAGGSGSTAIEHLCLGLLLVL